jgi:hypothetical protein
MENDEEDEFNLNLVLDLRRNNEGVPMLRVLEVSYQGKVLNIERRRHEIHERMMHDYFCDTSAYGLVLFCRRYQLRRSLFLTILERVCARDNYFVQKRDATRYLGLSPH